MAKRIRAERRCQDCGVNISDGPTNRLRCVDCMVAVMWVAGVEPLEPFPGPAVPWRCRCTRCGAEVTPRYANVAQGLSKGCRFCGQVASIDQRRLPENVAVARMRARGLEPQEPYRSSQTPWKCKCMYCGAEVTPTYNNIASGASKGCRDCGIAATADRCRTPAAKAVADMRAAGFEPQEPYKNNWTPWLCECQRCGERTSPTLHNVQSGHGCKHCIGRHSEGGFHVDEDAIVYLLTHRGYASVKVGISNHSDRRVRQHGKCGWEAALVVETPGTVAWNTERTVLDWWRKDLGLPVHLGPREMPQGGWTETVAASEVDLAATANLIQRLASAG